jgi:hypothetical protein
MSSGITILVEDWCEAFRGVKGHGKKKVIMKLVEEKEGKFFVNGEKLNSYFFVN